MSTELARNEHGHLIAGQGSLNPGGRPKQKIWRDAIMAATQRNPTGEPNKRDLDAIVEALIIAAKAGDMEAIKEIGNRIDGKAHQSVDVEANLTGELSVKWKSE